MAAFGVTAEGLKAFFHLKPVHMIGVPEAQDYMGWRRVCIERSGEGCDDGEETGLGVEEVMLRNDLHALSGFFRYAIIHNWTFTNPVMSDQIKLPSDMDAVRFHRITEAEEELYFRTALALGLPI